ncbi:target of Sbf [Arachnomyces sp. PD_36]|nr:target of Sbf [Arachnomyces sp. PD_36]
MHVSLAVGATLVASIYGVSAQDCRAGAAKNILGNWYCDAVDSISYTNFGSSGTYNMITDMTGGNCQSEPKEYSGPLAPLNDEVSWHFRGPVKLEKFAYYVPGTGLPDKRDAKPTLHERRHGHSHLHHNKEVRDIKRKAAMDQKRGVGDLVTTIINGQEVSWINTWDGTQDVAEDAPAAPEPAPAPVAPAVEDDNTPTQKQNSGSTDGGAPPVNAGWGNWGRQAFYDAEAGIADGLTFLNHHGGEGSGVFDYELGNSLSYASADGLSGSASPQCLNNELIGDNNEIIIMSDKKCNNGDCGAVRPGTVAHHGFGGDSKLFLIEFSMPITGKTGWNEDMPALWMLNAQIPRTLQYGKAECSCWESGCGEWDIFEVLDSGNTRCKSTLHGNISGGDSNYFNRPADKTIKAAVVYDGLSSTGHIKILDDATEFGETLSGIEVTGFTLESVLSSIFSLGS